MTEGYMILVAILLLLVVGIVVVCRSAAAWGERIVRQRMQRRGEPVRAVYLAGNELEAVMWLAVIVALPLLSMTCLWLGLSKGEGLGGGPVYLLPVAWLPR